VEDVDRRCTDVVFLLIFSFFWIGMFVVGGLGFLTGDPARLMYGTAYDGRPCGSGLDRVDKKYIYYPQMQTDLFLAYQDDPGKYNPALGGNPMNIPFTGVCVSTCPHVNDVIQHPAEPLKQWDVTMDTTDFMFRCLPIINATTAMSIECIGPAKALPTGGGALISCMGLPDCRRKMEKANPACEKVQTYEMTMKVQTAKKDPVQEQLAGAMAQASALIADLLRATPVVMIAGGGVGMTCGFFWLLLLEHFATFMTWFTVCLLQFLVAAGTYFFAQARIHARQKKEQERKL
jgi:choline transporter-like protein 2/4/5